MEVKEESRICLLFELSSINAFNLTLHLFYFLGLQGLTRSESIIFRFHVRWGAARVTTGRFDFLPALVGLV